jgi:hypothetical protein
MNTTYRDAKNVFLVIICIAALAMIGCRSFVDRFTPAEVAPQVSEYLGVEHQDITSLHDLKRKKDAVVIKHRETQTDLMRMAKDDEVYYEDAITFIQANITEAQRLQDLVVGSEDQPFSILGVLAGFTGGAAIGRALKRRGDLTVDEARAKGATV